MISQQYKCIFVHVPKTAGQSVENFFLALHGLSWEKRAPLLLKNNPDPALGPQSLAHLIASEYTSCGHLTQAEFDSYFKFSFVRNPWERLVSEFVYRRYDEKISFKDFVISALPEKELFSDSYRHIMPQYDYLYDGAGNQLVDFIGCFENLQNDFDIVCSKLGIADTTLGHVNSARQKAGIRGKLKSLFAKQAKTKQPYITYYDDETKEIVQQLYANDISTFGYKFGEK